MADPRSLQQFRAVKGSWARNAVLSIGKSGERSKVRADPLAVEARTDAVDTAEDRSLVRVGVRWRVLRVEGTHDLPIRVAVLGPENAKDSR